MHRTQALNCSLAEMKSRTMQELVGGWGEFAKQSRVEHWLKMSGPLDNDLPTNNKSITGANATLGSQSVAQYLVGVGGQVDQYVRHCKLSLVAGKN